MWDIWDIQYFCARWIVYVLSVNTNRNKDCKTQPEMPKTICCYNSLHSSCKVFLGPAYTKWSRSLHSHLSHRCWMEQRSAKLPHQTLKATSWWTGLGALLYAVALRLALIFSKPWKPQTKTTESCRQASAGEACCCQSPRVYMMYNEQP